jgi:ribosomal protein S18 acetylase RimI-like enzyme
VAIGGDRTPGNSIGRATDESEESGRATVREACLSDARAIARVHRRGLPDAFLSSLGLGVLTAVYRRLVRDEQAEVLVAERDGAVVGFVAGTLDPKVVTARPGLRLAIRAAPHMLRAGARRRALGTIAYEPPTDLPPAEILAIAIEPDHRRGGIAAALMHPLLARLRGKGAREVKVFVAESNEDANLFYAALGFTFVRTIEGRSGEKTKVWIAWKPLT